MKAQIITQVQMKSEAEGGRHSAISARYCPHLVVLPDPLFLGVWLLEVEESTIDNIVLPGTSAKVKFELMYEPNVDYSALTEGAEFNIHEGPRIVGMGTVLQRL